MSGFPKLVPAFTALVPITAPSTVGSVQAAGLTHVGFVPETGSLKSEPGYAVEVDAVLLQGSDFIRADPDLRHVRLQVDSLAKDKSGAFFRFGYTGILAQGGPASKVLSGAPDASTTAFGEAFTHATFESGDPKLRALQEKVFVASGRFVLEAGKPVTVEYKISEVTA